MKDRDGESAGHRSNQRNGAKPQVVGLEAARHAALALAQVHLRSSGTGTGTGTGTSLAKSIVSLPSSRRCQQGPKHPRSW